MSKKRKRRGRSRAPGLGDTKELRPVEWFKTEEGKDRLEAERKLVSEKFPDLQLQIPPNGNQPHWLGNISFRTSIGKHYTFKIRIVYPYRRYPDDEMLPTVYDEDGTFEPYPGQSYDDRHIVKDRNTGKRSFCLTLPDRKELVIREPRDFVCFLDAVLGYLEKQVIYDLNGGTWPGPDEAHGGLAIARFYLEKELETGWKTEDEEFEQLSKSLYDGKKLGAKVGRNQPCPCGSGRKAKRCHCMAFNNARFNLFRRSRQLTLGQLPLRNN